MERVILLEIDKGNHKIQCKDLAALVRVVFPEQKNKSEWKYKEFCKLIKKVPEKDFQDYVLTKWSKQIGSFKLLTDKKVEINENISDESEDEDEKEKGREEVEKPGPTEFQFNSDGIIKNVYKLNLEALKIAFEKYHNFFYNFANVDNARAQLSRLEKERGDKVRLDKSGATSESSLDKSEQDSNLEMATKSFIQPLKWEVPIFDGSTDAEDYMHKLETIAKVGEWKDDHKISALSLGLSGNAAMWLRNNETLLKDKTWAEVKKLFTVRFKKVTSIGDDWVIFSNRRQLASEEPQIYVENKIFLARNLKPKLGEDQLIEWIIRGLLPHIAQQLYLMNNVDVTKLKDNLSKVTKSFNLGSNMGAQQEVQSNSLLEIEEKTKEDSRFEKLEQMMAQLTFNNNFRGKSSNFKGRARNNYSSRGNGNFTNGYSGRGSYRGNGSYKPKYRSSYRSDYRSNNDYRSNSSYRSNSPYRSGSPYRSSSPYRGSFSGKPNFSRKNGYRSRSPDFRRGQDQKNGPKCGHCSRFGHVEQKCRVKRKFLEDQLNRMEN